MDDAGGTFKWLKDIKKLEAAHANLTSSTTRLPDHVDRGLTALEKCNEIAKFFSNIGNG